MHVFEFLTVAAEAVPRDKTNANRIFSFSMAAGEQANASLAAYIHRTPCKKMKSNHNCLLVLYNLFTHTITLRSN